MPKNQRIADLVLIEMAEHLLEFYPMFGSYCAENLDTGIALLAKQGSVVEDTNTSFGFRYDVESRGSPLGMINTLVIVTGQEEEGKIRINYREYEILPRPRQRAA